MTVKELMSILQTFPDDAEVVHPGDVFYDRIEFKQRSIGCVLGDGKLIHEEDFDAVNKVRGDRETPKYVALVELWT